MSLRWFAAFFLVGMNASAQEAFGVAVVAEEAATDAAWNLAREVYRTPGLRPSGLNDTTARALLGDALPKTNEPLLTELSELRRGIHGDDPMSRAALSDLARRLHVRAILVVFAKPIRAWPYSPTSNSFERVSYLPDTAQADVWTQAVQAVSIAYGSAPVTPAKARSGTRKFYDSPWFWGAVGAAAAGGITAGIISSTSGSSQIGWQMHIPR